MTLVGLTGGIGSGKSAVAAEFASLGATIIDGDGIARELVRPGTPALAEIVARFGDEYVDEHGELRRAALAERVFNDPVELAALDAIMDTRIQEQIAERAARAEGVVVVESPLLIERGRTHTVDVVVVVAAPMDVRLERLEARGVSRPDALARIASQASDDQRSAAADFVVVNDGSRQDLAKAVREIWEQLR